MDKNFLVLGSDYGTVEIIKELKKRKFHVIVADFYSETPAKKIADETWLISTDDIISLAKKCQERKVCAVITGASDFNVANSRKLCKVLDLPIYCSSDNAWKIATNKYEFKKLCKSVGAPIAEDYILTEEFKESDLKKIKFPVVVKPVDKNANRGMSYCDNIKDLKDAYHYARKISNNEHIIVERQLHGPEFAVNYVITNGKAKLLFFSSEHHQPGELANLYSVITVTKRHFYQYKAEVDEKVIEIFKCAGLREGVAWVECILDKDGSFYLLEMGYRFGGEIVNIPYKIISGFDSISWMINSALGIDNSKITIPNYETNFRKSAASYLLFSDHEGIIGKIEGINEIEKIPGVLVDITKDVGRKVAYHLTMGVIRIATENMDELCNIIKTINKTIVIEDVNGKNMLLRFDNYQELQNEYRDGLEETNWRVKDE